MPNADRLTVAERSVHMSLIRSGDTKPELAVRRLVHSMGYRYRLHVRNLPGKPDLVFAGRKKVIFVHGCFWHLHKDCRNNRPPKSRLDYWGPKLQRNAARDAEVALALKRAGWRSMTIWECQANLTAKLAGKIARFLGPR